MVPRSLFPLGLALCTLAATTSAQNLVVHDAAAATFWEGAGVSPLYPGAGVPINVYPAIPPLPPGPIGFAPPGAVSIDSTNGMTWFSNGPFIANTPHNAYPAGAPVFAPFPAPPVLGAGMVMGMAIDPVAGILWLTDGFVVAGVVPVPGGPVVVPPFAPFFGGLPPLSGLEWDPITGTLWAVDIGGIAYNFMPGGAPVGGPFPPPMPLPGPATGITIDKSGLAMPGMPRSVYVTGGGMVVDIFTGVPFPSFGGPMDVGITYHPAPSPMPAGAPCACPSYAMGQVLRGPMTAGNPNFGVDLVGLAPNNIVIFAFDFAGFNPAFPMLNTVGCPFGLNFATAIGFGALADAAGTAALPISLVGIPAGFQFYMQYVAACPGDAALGIVITPLYQVRVSAP